MNVDETTTVRDLLEWAPGMRLPLTFRAHRPGRYFIEDARGFLVAVVGSEDRARELCGEIAQAQPR